MTLSDCAKEAATQHHMGEEHGHGPLSAEEVVVLAVFEKTAHEGNRLIATTFPVKQLNRGEISLAREMYTTSDTFESEVVRPAQKNWGDLVGVARVDVGTLRNIPYEIAGSAPVLRGRGVCVLDRVVPGDHDGHAALEYSESLDRLSDKQRGIIRSRINGDIAEAFGEIVQLKDAFNTASNIPSTE
jgi:hypothetical protein